MRSPIYNDRGQFRYSDFVAYIPEFLKSEPDVVTLLQVFSDYINNAYRNIDTVEKFEFAIVAKSGDLSGAVSRMSYLRTMLALAGSRNDYVNLLSVPRANVKSNAVFGRDSGLSAYTMNYGGVEIVDRIENASSVDAGISAFSDGDVVFVKYDAIPGETGHEVAYYYDAASNALIRDPDGTSQDPFTGTDNSSSRILSFKVSDVSEVNTRYGHTTGNGTQYREVFFTARIYDVKTDSAVKEITLPGGQSAVIDYYDVERTAAGTMRTVLRFDGEAGWKWKNGYPSAIIYLSETSGANIGAAGGSDDTMLPINKCVDPAYMETLDRYTIIGTPVEENGMLTVQLGSCYPAYANGTVYLAIKRNLRILGEFSVIKDARESGTMDLHLVPNGPMPDLDGVGEMVLIDVPLFYGRGVLDYAQASPLVRFGKIFPLDRARGGGNDTGSLHLVPDGQTIAYACESVMNDRIGELNILRKEDTERTANDAYMDGGYTIVVPFESEIARNFGTTYDLGDRIYISDGYGYWDGLAIVNSVSRNGDEIAIQLVGLDAPIRPFRTDSPAVVSVASVGYFAVKDGSVADGGYYNASRLSDDGTVVMLAGNSYSLVARMFPGGTFDRDVPDDTYTMEIISRTDDRVRNLLQVDERESMTTTVWSRSRGDLFTRPYMMVTDGNGDTFVGSVVFRPGEEVARIVENGNYRKGQYVYDPVSRKVYMCGEDCTVRDINSVSASSIFVEDRIVHYSVPYTEMYNAFMPYYGPIAPMKYGSAIEYTSDPEVFMAPLYITKVEEKALKYGWEHREFLKYGDGLNLSGRDRNGMAEFHTTERTRPGERLTADCDMDIVNTDLFERCDWSYQHDVVAKGCASTVKVDVDDPLVICATRADDTTWRVTIHSAAHGLVDGSIVSVTGMAPAKVKGITIDLNAGLVPVNVVDGDTFTYDVPADSKLVASRCCAERGDIEIVYVQDHNAGIAEISYDDDRNLSVMFTGKVHGAAVGDMMYLDGCLVDGIQFSPGPYEVVEVNSDFTGVTLAGRFDALPVPTGHAIIRKPIAVGDVVAITDSSDKPVKFYEVRTGIWTETERNSLITPLELFSQTNLFDVSVTNPVNAMGDPIRISDIIYTDNDIATVHLESPLVHFTPENRPYIEGKTVVRIDNVNPSDFNGYHVVETIHSPTSFDISMRLYNDYARTGSPVGDLDMTLRECRWYKFTIDEIEWDKVSSRATFTGKNRTTPTVSNGDGISLMCEYDHSLEVGDYAVLGFAFDEFDETSGLVGYAMGRVTSVPDARNLELDIVYGTYVPGMSINRGVITLPGSDNLPNRYNEYSMRLDSIGGNVYQFKNGDIVIAAGQLVPSEQLAYLVRDNARWSVLKKKRIIKIRRASVDEYPNGEYMEDTFENGLDEYKYVTYSDVDVAKSSRWAYASRMYMVRNPVFDKPAIDGMDTTRNPNAEYSSGEDFANVAPRDDMKPSFRGVPDLKYPLVEKIERLAYLRDANVIDFELIEYLARFMGYDITPMAEDVRTSNLYRTIKQQEAAIREVVINLPQYYAIGGTDAGLKMLMGTFGVIGNVLTLYTNTMHPYEEMLNKGEVDTRLEEDTAAGTLEGTWVSTPYIDIELSDDSRFPQFAVQNDDIRRIREQIRVWKPIQVVFRDILLRYVGEVGMRARITGPIVGVSEFGTAIGLSETDETVEPEYVDPGLTNCAF